MLGGGGGSSASAGGNGGNIKFVAVARATDGAIVASYVTQKGDYDFDKYNNAVREIVCAPDFQFKVTPGSRYRLVSTGASAFNFTTDVQQRMYIVITSADYPERLAFPMLNKLQPLFKQEFGEQALTCEPGALNKKAESMFSKLVKEYDDPSKDKLSEVQAKVDDVKVTMHSNIDGMLRNLDKTEQIEQDADRLQDQARLFDKQARTLKNREQWKNRRLMLIIAAIILVILVLVIVSIAK